MHFYNYFPFIIYLIEVFHSSPEWEDYCGAVKAPRMAIEEKGEIIEIDQATCEQDGGTWRDNYCDYQYECQKQFDEANDKHRYVIFLTAVPAGLIAVAIGIILALPSVSTGLMIGGVFLTIYGTANYWDNFSNWIKVTVLGIVLALLIWLGYKKLGN